MCDPSGKEDIETKLLTPALSEPNSEFDFAETDSKSNRAAYASNYYETSASFIAEPNVQTLQALDRALTKVNSNDIDLHDAEKLLQSLRSLLDPKNGIETVLWSCQVVVKFQISKPESRWLGSIDVTERAASSFRDVALKLLSEGQPVPPEFSYTIDSWVSLIKIDKLDEHQKYPLITSALKWIFHGNDITVIRSFVSFVAQSYARVLPATQDQIVYDILSAWTTRTSLHAARTMVELVLTLIATRGKIAESIWEQSVSMKSRSLIDKEAQIRHTDAISAASLISRRLIDLTWSAPKNSGNRADLQEFLTECVETLKTPRWASSEIFVSAFITSLLKVANIVRSHKYARFMFDCLYTFNEVLSQIPKNTDDENKDTSLVIQSIYSCGDDDQAVYLASRFCLLPNPAIFDLYDALARRSLSQDTKPISQEDWFKVLAKFPLASYYSKLSGMICDMASREDLKEQAQVEMFHVLENIVVQDPSCFRHEWLNRLNYASSTVCEALVPVAAVAYEKTKDPQILRQIASRVSAPGASNYKRRVLSLLERVLNDEDGNSTGPYYTNGDDSSVGEDNGAGKDVRAVSWQTCIIASTDLELLVRTTAMGYARTWIAERGGLELAEALAKCEPGPELSLIQRGLGKIVAEFRTTDIAQFKEIQNLVAKLLTDNLFDLALIFVRADGGFVPLSQFTRLFGLYKTYIPPVERIQILQIMERALSARPRMILPPAVATELFASLLNELKVASAAEMECIGSILGHLVFLGSPQVQHERKRVLKRVSVSALNAAANSKTKEDIVFRQSVMILGCTHHWLLEMDDLIGICHKLKDWLDLELSWATRKLIIQSIFQVAANNATIFNDPQIGSTFANFSPGSVESALFTRLILNFLWTNGEPTSEKHDLSWSSSAAETTTAPRFNDTQKSDTLAAWRTILQDFLNQLLAFALETEDITTLKVVVKALDDNLLVANETIPIVAALCFASRPGVAPIALRSFVNLCERWPHNLELRFVEGIKKVNYSEPSPLPFSPFSIMWQVMKQNIRQKSLKPVIDQLAPLLSPFSPTRLMFRLIDSLMEVEMDLKEAKYLSNKIEDTVNRFDPSKHDREECARAIIAYIFVLWLRRKYEKAFGKTALAATSSATIMDVAEELEKMDYESIWKRLLCSDFDTRRCLDQLWRLPDQYGSARMNTLIYGRSEKRSLSRIESVESEGESV